MGCKRTRKGGNGKRKKIYKKRTTQTKRLRITNKFNDTFLESSSDEDEGNNIYYISNCETELEPY